MLGELEVYEKLQANAKDREAKTIMIRIVQLQETDLIGNTWMPILTIEKKEEPDALGNDRWIKIHLSDIHPRSILQMTTISFQARKELEEVRNTLYEIRTALNDSPVIFGEVFHTMPEEIARIIAEYKKTKKAINDLTITDVIHALNGETNRETTRQNSDADIARAKPLYDMIKSWVQTENRGK